MDIIELHGRAVGRYKEYIRSFIDIRDADIREEVTRQLDTGKLWPEPLIQFNPAYQPGESIKQLVADNVLHTELQHVFSGFNLYWHQEQALRLGGSAKSFVVTSGTGSGKSLTYIGTILSRLFSTGYGSGVKALVVYPMNALINSQIEELKRHAARYEESKGAPFPITFNAYTGQTKNEVRKQISESPPDILLTNYMMLELLLTRAGEEQLRNSIFHGIEHLVFDELHTYRGRQGADVSYLIRRIKALAEKKVICMGTSATMASRGSYQDQQRAVAEVAGKIFGETITTDQVIGERLERSLHWAGELPTGNALKKPFSATDDIEDLKAHPLATWLENKAAVVETEDFGLQRQRPTTATILTEDLAEATDMGSEAARAKVLDLLTWIAAVNKRQTDAGERYTCLPFKLHQFFAQTGSVYATLGLPGDRKIMLEPGIYEGAESAFVYPHVFSRGSGATFVCVTVDQGNGRFLPREFGDSNSSDGDDFGYILPEYSNSDDDVFWTDSQDDLASLPQSWVNQSAAGLRWKRSFGERAPKRIYYNIKGEYSTEESDDCPLRGWYMSAKENGLLFDPTAGMFFEGNTSERTKLTTLGNEGRSTSTTITSFILLRQLEDAGFPWPDQKLLSFTDNRQDAALQSGHFNDFMRIVRVRAGIHQALVDAKGNTLTSAQLGRAIREAMNLALPVYSENTEAFPAERRRIDERFEMFLTYQAIRDLRRGWRVVLPNLEKCALLEIDYADLVENAEHEEGWRGVPLFEELNGTERTELLRTVLDYFRHEYALISKTWLTSSAIQENTQIIKSTLRGEWSLTEDEIKPAALRCGSLHRRNRVKTSSLGLVSALGKYLKHYAKENALGVDLGREGYAAMLERLLRALTACGYLEAEEVRDTDNQPTHIYRLKIEALIWKLGDGEHVRRDVVKQRSYRDLKEKPNDFFRDLYRTDYRKMKNFAGADHTGQLGNDDRIQREERFRAEWKIDVGGGRMEPDLQRVNAESLSALFCSPTMELGIDISQLSVVHMRNAPPNAANYAQRSGRAGRSGQAALVFSYCSAYSPHDRHYFNHRDQLVAGTVEPPRLDIANRELIRSHLHAVFMTKVGLRGVRQSALEIIDLEGKGLPLREEVRRAVTLDESAIKKLIAHFKTVLVDKDHDATLAWCNDNWLTKQLQQLPVTLDKAMDRWRNLFREAQSTLDRATSVLNSGMYATTTDEHKRAKREVFQAQRQIDLLKNDDRESGQQSEFYVFRYLAAEGFLPGYNFTRLPIRVFLTDGYEKGEFVSRPRFIALREFGPRNVIYHSGQKFVVSRAIMPSVVDNLTSARVCRPSGYWLDESQAAVNQCPLTGTDLSDAQNKTEMVPLLPLSEMIANNREHITCEEEERSRQGFEIETYFSIDGGDRSSMRRALVKLGGEILLIMSFLPAARLVQLSKKERRVTEEGYRIGLESGLWNPKDDVPDPEETRRVKLFTETTADALYIQPIKALALDSVGVISLQYALKRAIELRFQIEPAELGVCPMGEGEVRNMLFYEASEGSLGVLSSLVDDPAAFREVVEQAIQVCDFKDKSKPKATYDDLLSYYNQPHHLSLDRFSIESALDRLGSCDLDCSQSEADDDYEAQFKRLLAQMDANSSTEETFLRFLYQNNLRLPDEAQKTVEGVFVQPDFYYKPDTWVFCDGTPHDDPETQADDAAKRKAIRDRGDEVIVYYYKDDLNDLVAKYPDIFKKVR